MSIMAQFRMTALRVNMCELTLFFLLNRRVNLLLYIFLTILSLLYLYVAPYIITKIKDKNNLFSFIGLIMIGILGFISAFSVCYFSFKLIHLSTHISS